MHCFGYHFYSTHGHTAAIWMFQKMFQMMFQKLNIRTNIS